MFHDIHLHDVDTDNPQLKCKTSRENTFHNIKCAMLFRVIKLGKHEFHTCYFCKRKLDKF